MKTNESNPFITILVPIRNEAEWIASCLQSILAQDYDRDQMEVLVIDGESTDQTTAIIKRFEQKDQRIRVFNNPKQKVAHALNIGLQLAKGDLLVRVDGHATIEKQYLKKCVSTLQQTGADCVGGKIISINSSIIGKGIALAMSSIFGVGNARFRTSGAPGFVDTLAFGAYRAEWFQKIGSFDNTLVRCQDDEFNYRLRKAGGKIYFNPNISATYFPRSDFIKLWKQYFQYGFYKVRVMRRHFSMMQIRQFVPALFVFALGLSALCSCFNSGCRIAFAFVAGIYLITNILFSLIITARSGLRFIFIVPIAFLILHLSYGLGFICGVVFTLVKKTTPTERLCDESKCYN
ncbi:MAG TPA: glycosyltransferase family 2 protein [bacterium]|nr:glycosyltransferase family 2 protein [bacterium]HOX85837.1 glycosyltransferase family 2 protein [bacterium]HPG45180.1 glycosyltransferase family 2 protein [bacterium]HPM97422.1 glycosyltransferase family 2 protein [bacterium]